MAPRRKDLNLQILLLRATPIIHRHENLCQTGELAYASKLKQTYTHTPNFHRQNFSIYKAKKLTQGIPTAYNQLNWGHQANGN